MITGTWLNNFKVQKSQRRQQEREISVYVRKISIIFDYEMIDIFLTIMIDKP
jgi:hypothetical protein